jgi:hypothetical protein
VNTSGGDFYAQSQHASGENSVAAGRDAATGDSTIASGEAQVAEAGSGRSAAAGNSAAVTVGPSIKDRAAAAPWWSKLVAIVVATILLIAGKTDVGVAGYIVAAVAVIIGAIPVFRG